MGLWGRGVVALLVAVGTAHATVVAPAGATPRAERPALTASTTAIAGDVVVLRARLAPRMRRPVRLQQRIGGQWAAVARGRSTGAGRVRLPWTAVEGVWRLRVLAPSYRSKGRRHGRVVSRAVTLTVAGRPPASSPRGPAPWQPPITGPTRIMLVGDSVTHGSSGDWTWRYRLWQHLVGEGAGVDLVGPRSDLWSSTGGTSPDRSYVDSAFDTDHAARWGMTSGIPDWTMESLMQAHRPHVVVEMLGVNDLGFLLRSPADVAADLRARIAAARAAAPGVAYVVAEATQHWFPLVPALNQRLAEVVTAADTPESPVVLADTDAGYGADADTYDLTHPNARGEVRIAAAVADALATIGLGRPALRPLVLPDVGPRVAATLTGQAGDGTVQLTWVAAPGATSQMVWRRDVTADGEWQRLPEPLEGTATVLSGLENGTLYAFRIQPRRGDDLPEGSIYSNVVTLAPVAENGAPAIR